MGLLLSVWLFLMGHLSAPVWAESTVSASPSPRPSFSPLMPSGKKSPSLQILEEEFPIPKKYDAPPSLGKKVPETPQYPCYRQFIYQGKSLGCDSYLREDAENLRPYLANVPAAMEQFNLYQQTRRNIQSHAYLGTAGLLVFLAGYLISNQYVDAQGNLTSTGRNIRYFVSFPGIIFAGANGIFAFVTLQKNESRLGSAVQLYNQAYPDNPIELQFSTGVKF